MAAKMREETQKKTGELKPRNTRNTRKRPGKMAAKEHKARKGIIGLQGPKVYRVVRFEAVIHFQRPAGARAFPALITGGRAALATG